MAQLGRISGPLLKENLLRNGKDLTFRNTQETTQLLYIDVNTNRIGVNTGTPTNELQNVGTLKTIDLITGPSTVAGFNISDGKIEAIGNIELNAAEAVIFSTLENGTLRFNDNTISSILSSSHIDIVPNGSGNTNIESNLNVIGDLTATGSITLDGTINFGNAADDSTYPVDTVTFETEIDSDIIPDQSDTYNLGANQKRWNEIYTNLVNGQAVNATQLTVGTIDFTLRQGNIFYVAQNGSDTNKGDHPQSPVASIRRALELADASIGGPVAIFVNAGDYEEETPLVVPSNVSIIGIEMRNVNVFPTSYTQSEDVFHLNGETTIQNITVKDFYFDDNTGYAFRFAPDAVISTRSPYVQNCTVITKGSNITVNDPRGFNSGDAGRGAYVDGAELNSASVDASMLFHSVTFITPGVDGLTMTNGVRVEWLNSFTYFANRGLYAFNNSTGRVLQDGSTIGYGAELRSIGSANVYGNYGAVADGADTLMYLIQHNFGYIGSGNNSENDLGLVVQANEVVEENSGTIYYSTTDQSGNYRVGDNFIVDFDTGGTSINLSALAADSLNGIIVTTGIDTTVFKGDRVETGNLRFTGNTVETLSGNLIIDTPLAINLQDNTNISNNLDIIGDLSFDGNLNLLGNQTTDTLVFNVDFDQDFSPNQTLAFNLGSPSKEWLTAHLSRLESGDISFYDNVIETNTSNADLELKPSGTGNVYIPQNATISNALIVNQTSNLQDVNISGNLSINGDLNLIGSGQSTENVDVSENLTVGASVEFEEILIDTNVVTTTTTNANLELRASGTGTIKILNNDFTVTNNLDIAGDTFTSDIISSQQISAVKFTNTTYEITSNKIDTVVSNANLELRANGTGDVIIPNNDVQISNNLTVDGVTNLDVTAINGTLTQVGDTTHTGNYDIAGELTVDNVYVEDNFISTTTGNLSLIASGTGIVNIDTNDVEIAQDLTVSGDTSLQEFSDRQEGSVSLDNTLYNPNAYDTAVGDRFGWTTAISNNYIIVGAYQEDDADGTNSGKAYIFDKTTGNLLHTLDNPNPPSGWSDPEVRSTEDRFAWSVAISDSYAVVGAPQEDKSPSAQLSGKVYIFDVITGNLLHTLNSTNEDQFDQFGYSVAVTGNKVIVGAIGDGDFSQEGVVYVFDATTGSLLQRITNPSLTSNSFGESLASSDSYFIVGHNGSNEARIFDINTYSVLHTLTNPLAAGGDTLTDFGKTLDITDKYAIVGAPYQDGDPGDNQGKAYIFDVATGSLLHTLDHPEPGPNDRFSFSVAISDTYAVVGTPYLDNGADLDSGKVYVFDVSTGLLLHTIDNPNIGYNKSGDRFGFSVAILGNTFIASAPEEDVTEEGGSFVSSSGVAYTFNLIDTIEPVAVPVDVNITGTLTHVGDTAQTGNLDIAGEITNGNILIEDNFITSTNTNSDLELRANGTGEVVIDSSDSLTINNNLFVGGILEYQGTLTIDGNVTLQGNIQDGSLTVTEDFDVTGTLDISSQAQFEDIRIQDNFVTTTQSNSNLELRAAGTGEVLIPNNNLQVNNNLFTASISTGDINVNNDFVLDEIVITDSNIEINENYITTKISNADLELRATGNVVVQENAILSQDLTVNTDTDLQSTNINGTLTHTGDRTQTGDYTLTGNLNLGSLVTDRELQFDDVRVSGNVLETTLSNSNLDLRASGTGEVLFNENVQMGQDLTVGDLNVGSISVDTDVAFEEIELSTDIQFEDNYITTTNSNSNLELRAAGAGKVFLQELDLGQNIIGVVGSGVDSSVLDITLSPSEDLIVNSTSVLQIPKGDTSQRVVAQDEFLDGGVALNSGTILDGGDANTIFGAGDTIYNSGGSILSTSGNLGDIRFNTDDNVFEGTSTSTITFNGIYSTDRQTSVTADPTSNNIRFVINGAASPLDSSNLVGEVTGEGLIIHGLQVDDVLLDNNVITTNVSNSDLDLATNGTGELVLDDLSFKSNLIKNNANNLIVKHTGLGYAKASGTFGIVVPSGATITPTPNPQVGDTRWNTSAQQLETWDGTEYISSAGVASAITPEEFDDLLLEYTIIFG